MFKQVILSCFENTDMLSPPLLTSYLRLFFFGHIIVMLHMHVVRNAKMRPDVPMVNLVMQIFHAIQTRL